MDLGIENKRALITGSTSGIGAGIAKALAREGAAVVIHGRDLERAEGVAVAIRAEGGRAAVALGDVSTDEGAAESARRALEAFGGIDILVNNAGGMVGAGQVDWMNASVEDWASTYSKNTLAAVRMARLMVAPMRERRWGRVIQISSVAATEPLTSPHYGATKAALSNFSLALSKKLSRSGVTCNTVSPGMIRTPALERWFGKIAAEMGWGDDRERAEAHVLKNLVQQSVDRFGTPEDVGRIVSFLASPLADFINGANFRIDGGAAHAVL